MGTLHSLLPLSLAWAAFAAPSPAQAILREWTGTMSSGPIGADVASLPDVDGDGVPDVAYTTLLLGGAEVHSGRAGALLWSIAGTVLELSPLADFDGDSFPEVGVARNAGLDVFSGRTGALAYSIPLTLFDAVTAAAPHADLDGDGVAELLLGVPDTNPRAPGPGTVRVRSGRDGAALFTVSGGTLNDQFGSCLAPLPDIDGDGVADFAAGAPNGLTAAPSVRRGYVRACSGATGATLWRHDGTSSFPSMGRALAPTGDFDGDGRDDLVASSVGHQNGTSSGRLTILSSATGLALAHVDGLSGHDLGADVADAGDVDGDGVRDLLAMTFADQAWLISGATLLTLHTFEDLRGPMTGSQVSAGRDYDRDGRADVVLGDVWAPSPAFGLVTIHGGNDLFLDLTPIVVADGDSLSRTIRTGIPGNSALLVVVDVNGDSTWTALGGIRTFDALGSIEETVTVPPGMAGYVVTYQAFAINAKGKLSRSDREVVTFR